MGPTCVFVPTFCCEMMLLYNYHWKSVKIGIFVLIRILFLPDLTYFTIWFCSFFQLFDHSNLEMIRTCVITTSQNTQREIRWVSLLFWHSLKQVFCVRRNEWETSQPVSHWFDDLLWIRRICFLWLSVDFIACRCCCCLFLLCSNHCDMYQTKKLIILSEFGALFMRDASIVMMWLKLNFNVIVELWFAPFVPNCNKKNLRVFYARCCRIVQSPMPTASHFLFGEFYYCYWVCIITYWTKTHRILLLGNCFFIRKKSAVITLI